MHGRNARLRPHRQAFGRAVPDHGRGRWRTSTSPTGNHCTSHRIRAVLPEKRIERRSAVSQALALVLCDRAAAKRTQAIQDLSADAVTNQTAQVASCFRRRHLRLGCGVVRIVRVHQAQSVPGIVRGQDYDRQPGVRAGPEAFTLLLLARGQGGARKREEIV